MAPQRRPDPGRSTPSDAALPQPASRWQIQLLGRFRARNGDIVITRLPTRAMTSLLARLATTPGQVHSREALIELIWPQAETAAAGARSLRTALSTLRTLFEPLGVLPHSVIGADRQHAWIEAAAIDCDAAQFEAQVRAGHLDAARDLYQGELLPGLYDEWVLRLRERLAELAASLPRPLPAAPRPAPAAPPAPERAWRQLPTYPSTFIGRQAELPALLEDVARHRCVTVTGFAGCGKTRLAVAAAEQAQGFQVVAFASLVDCLRPEQLHEHLRRALGLERGAGPVEERIAAFLQGRRTLLLLDNFEHLARLPAAVAAVAALLARHPQLHLLVSSRRALRLADEHEFALPPLPTPAESDPLEVVASNPAALLFCDRARRSRPDFQIHARNRQALARLCQALDGLPYQIEIAARKIRQFTPAQMCESIARQPSVLALTGPSARRNPRHSSPRVAIEWSWRLLSAHQRRALACLALFRGGWTAAAAAAVIGTADAQALLDEFQLSSLIRLDVGAGVGARYDMLASMREFLRGRISAPKRLALRQRHRAHYAEWARRQSPEDAPAMSAELPNIALALATALADGDLATGAALALDLGWYWTAQGVPGDILATMSDLAAALPASMPSACELLCLIARLAVVGGDKEQARACAERALARAGEQPALRAEALLAVANVDWLQNQDGATAWPVAERSLQLAEASGSAAVTARARNLLAVIQLVHFQRPDTALALFVQAEAELQAVGDSYGSLLAATGRIQCLNMARRFDEAIDAALRTWDDATRLHQVSIQLLLCNRLSLSYEGARRFADAVDICRHQARTALRHGMTYHFAFAVWNQCRPLARIGQAATAVRLAAFSQQHWQALFGPLSAEDRRAIGRLRRLAAWQIGHARCAQLWAEGLAMPEAEVRPLATG